jgi:hypothetical protein
MPPVQFHGDPVDTGALFFQSTRNRNSSIPWSGHICSTAVDIRCTAHDRGTPNKLRVYLENRMAHYRLDLQTGIIGAGSTSLEQKS